MSAASMIAAHLNVPYGPVVTKDDVVESLRKGTFWAATADAKDILISMFVECRRQLVERAGAELGVPATNLKGLYLESLRMGMHHVPEWDVDESDEVGE